MRSEPPAERLQRRLGRRPDTDPAGGDVLAEAEDPAASPAADPDVDSDVDSDPNSLLPRWLPDRPADRSWLSGLRADPGRAGAVALAVIAAVAVLVTVFTLVRNRPAPVVSAKLPPVEMVATEAPAGPAATAAPVDRVVVSVVGLVHRPGLATLVPGARVADALEAAGGALDGADTTGLNMARPLADGEQIVVGIAAPPGWAPALGSSVGAGSTGAAATAPAPQAPQPTGSAAAEPVDLNTATAQQLEALPGVGPVTAAAIVAWRGAHGKFVSVDQLCEVDGIGPARLERLRALVRV